MAIIYVMGVKIHEFKWGHGITHLSYGLAIAFALVPIHEYIHVLAYRSQGAKHTSYDVNLKKFYFMALADKFVANKKAFFVVALAPFLSISFVLLLTMPFVSIEWALTISGVLLVHTSMCAGDFGLMSYFEYHKDLQVITYDDVPNKTSYFWGKSDEKGMRNYEY